MTTHIIYGPEDDPQPQEGDYLISDAGRLGAATRVSIVGEYNNTVFGNDKDAMLYIREKMKDEGFHPDTWRISDHGNISLIQVEDL